MHQQQLEHQPQLQRQQLPPQHQVQQQGSQVAAAREPARKPVPQVPMPKRLPSRTSSKKDPLPDMYRSRIHRIQVLMNTPWRRAQCERLEREQEGLSTYIGPNGPDISMWQTWKQELRQQCLRGIHREELLCNAPWRRA